MGRSMDILSIRTLALMALVFLPTTTAKQSYCSSQNTGAGNQELFDIYQSNGWCFDHCKENYALAVVQGNSCWCSNYLPEDQTDTGDCDKSCPGYPDERCGSEDGKLYGYITLNKKPSGTQGLPKPTPAPPSPAPPSSVAKPEESHRDPETVVQTVVESTVVESAPAITLTPSEKSKSTPPPETTEKPKPTTSSEFTASEATTAVQTLVSDGPLGRVTITTTVVYRPTGAPAPVTEEKENSKSNTGAIVGGVLGGLAVLAAVVGGVIFLLFRQRRKQGQEEMGEVDEFGVQRHTSTMSKHGLLRSEKTQQPAPAMIATNIRNSRLMQDNESVSPGSGHSNRRDSRPYIFDQRLNPSAIMMQDNASRGSFASMDDSRDYGRTLNVRNPDPDPDLHAR